MALPLSEMTRGELHDMRPHASAEDGQQIATHEC